MRDSRAARKEAPAWFNLVRWIDAQPRPSAKTVNDLRRRPMPATRKSQPESLQA